MLLHQKCICLVQEISCIDFFIIFALFYLFFELGVMDCSLDKVNIHQFSLLNEVLLILIFKVLHLFVLALYGLADADKPFQLGYLRLPVVFIHIFKIFEKFIEDIFIFFD